MPKTQAAHLALQAYSHQQRVGQLACSRLRTANHPEPPMSDWICELVEMATQWVAHNAPEVPSGQRNREVMALVGDFLSLTPRGAVSNHTYQERFQDYLDGAAPASADREN